MRKALWSSIRFGVRASSILCLALLLAPALASAQRDEPAEPGDYGRPGWSLGLGFAYGLENFKHVGHTASAPGLDFRVGYQMERYLAVIMNFQYLDGFQADALRAKGDSFGAWTVSANVKAGYPVSRFYPYAMAGIGGFDAELDSAERDFLGRAGAGVDLYITDNIVLDLEAMYNWPLEVQDSSSGLQDLQFITLVFGTQYRFD